MRHAATMDAAEQSFGHVVFLKYFFFGTNPGPLDPDLY
jgi:hypothetical protein